MISYHYIYYFVATHHVPIHRMVNIDAGVEQESY